MGLAKIGDYTFRIDPNSVTWSYKLNTKEIETYGGKVIQLLSCAIDSMTIEGEVGKIGFGGLVALGEHISQLMDYHVSTQAPVLFLYPPRNWSGYVFVTGFPQIADRVGEVSWPYRIQLEIVEGFETIKKSIMVNSLAKLHSGIDYHPESPFSKPPGGADWDTAWAKIVAEFSDAGDVSKFLPNNKTLGNTPFSDSGSNSLPDGSVNIGGFSWSSAQGLTGVVGIK